MVKWLSTIKSEKDVEESRKIAKAQRRQRKKKGHNHNIASAGRTRATNGKAARTNQNNKKKNDLEDFLVDSDESDTQEIHSIVDSEDDDEEIQSPENTNNNKSNRFAAFSASSAGAARGRSTARPATKPQEMIEVEDDSEDDADDDGQGLFASYEKDLPKRRSVVPKEMTGKRTKPGSMLRAGRNNHTNVKQEPLHVPDDTDNESDVDGGGDLLPALDSRKRKQAEKKKRATYQEKENVSRKRLRKVADKNKDNSDQGQRTIAGYLLNKTTNRTQTKGVAARSTAVGSDDEFDPLEDTPTKTPIKTHTNRKDDLSDEPMTDREQEEIQMALAMSLSEHESTPMSPMANRKKKKSLDDSDEDSKPKPVVMKKTKKSVLDEINLLSENDAGDDEDHEDDEFKGNNDEREAEKVLAAANKLSATVLKTMARWSSTDGDSVKSQASVGMISEGALSLSTIAESKNGGDDGNGHLFVTEEQMKAVCSSINLKPYQLIGVNWLSLLHGLKIDVGGSLNANVNGILADTMGLGKTVQTIAFLALLRKREMERNVHAKVKPHLVVVPASVLSNWKREFNKVAPDMIVVRYHGSEKERVQLRKEIIDSDPDVILTTFSYFSSEKADDRKFFRKFDLNYLVVDEAHCLKNPRGARYKNLNKIESEHRLLLTGTPVQNSPQELMALLCFLMPLFSPPKGSIWDKNKSKDDGGEGMLQHFVLLESKNSNEKCAYRKLKELFAPFVLRRRKEDVLSTLPPKIRKVEYVFFDNSTQKVYNNILEKHLKQQKGALVKDVNAQQHLFTALRKAANHPLLLRTRHTDEKSLQHMAEQFYMYKYFGNDETCSVKLVKDELKGFSDFDLHEAALDVIAEREHREAEMHRYTLTEEALYSSPKFKRLKEMLPQLIRDGHRVLVFSQWTKCLDLLERLLAHCEIAYRRLDGQTKIGERQNLIDEFNGDDSIPVFLLSTRAGGMGINLTSADTVIIHDLDFNPFNDLQAEDRCHRLGQEKPVTVIKLVTRGTVDEDIYNMQERKAKMNAAILDNGTNDQKKAKSAENESEVRCMLMDAIQKITGSNKVSAEG